MTDPRPTIRPIALDPASLDRVSGGSERDGSLPPEYGREINGTDGRDVIFGGSGDDTIASGADDDYVRGGQGADLVDLGAGDDRMEWNPFTGNDTVQGGEGTDTLILSMYDISTEDLLAAINPAPGSPGPFVDENGMISLAGVSGTISIGDSTLTFSGFERIFVNA
jgi:Ca2+-binding RTX toxin-like protein